MTAPKTPLDYFVACCHCPACREPGLLRVHLDPWPGGSVRCLFCGFTLLPDQLRDLRRAYRANLANWTPNWTADPTPKPEPKPQSWRDRPPLL